MQNSAAEWGSIGPPWWDDRPVLIVGAGPSLEGFDLTGLQGLGYVVGVNGAIDDLPFADVHFSLDLPWMRRRNEYLTTLAAAIPVYLAVPDEHPATHAHVPGAIYLRRMRDTNRLCEKYDAVESGGTSGFGAFNFVYLKRARRIVLFGFDYADGGTGHYCPERYPWHAKGHNAIYWPRWATNFRDTLPQLDRAGARVLNASPKSNIDAFPRCTPDEAVRKILSDEEW